MKARLIASAVVIGIVGYFYIWPMYTVLNQFAGQLQTIQANQARIVNYER